MFDRVLNAPLHGRYQEFFSGGEVSWNKRPFKNDVTEKSAIFEPLPPWHSLSLIFRPPFLVTDQKMAKYFQINHPRSVFWVQCECSVHNTPYLTSTYEQLNEKTYLICTLWHQLDVRYYVNFKFQKFHFKKILFIWLERRGWFFWSFSAKATYRYSANTLRGVLQKYLELFCKNIERCSVKLLRQAPHSYDFLF